MTSPEIPEFLRIPDFPWPIDDHGNPDHDVTENLPSGNFRESCPVHIYIWLYWKDTNLQSMNDKKQTLKYVVTKCYIIIYAPFIGVLIFSSSSGLFQGWKLLSVQLSGTGKNGGKQVIFLIHFSEGKAEILEI